MRLSLYISFVSYMIGSLVFNYYLNTGGLFKSDESATTFWMTFNALAKTFAFLSLYKLLKATDRVLRSFAFTMFILSLNDLLDELFFNPYYFQINEVLLTIVLTWYITQNFYARKS